MNTSLLRIGISLTVILSVAACGDGGPVEPNLPRETVAGTYRMSALQFDPQGSLPNVDALERLRALDKPDPSLTLLSDGKLQLLFEDPGSGLLRLVEGSFRTTPEGAVLDFGGNSAYRALLLSRDMAFVQEGSGQLVFSAEAPSGAEQSALLKLVPEWSAEPLLNPVPGVLNVAFAPIS